MRRGMRRETWRLAVAQVRQQPAAFVAVAATTLLAVATITLFATLIAGDVATPAHLKDQGPGSGAGSGPGEDGLGVIAGIFAEGAIIVSLLVMVNCVGFAVRRQLRELALLRTIAATPRQVRMLVRREALAVVAVVTPPGWVLGWLGAHLLLPALKDHGYAAEAIDVPATPLPLVLAGVGAGLIVVGAAAVAVRRATRGTPAAALADTASEPRRVDGPRRVLGGVAVAAVGVLTLVNLGRGGADAADGAFPVLLAGLLALAVLGPLATGRVAAALGALPRSVSPRIGWLADAHLQGHVRRLTAAVVPLAVLGALAVNFLLIPPTLARAGIGAGAEASSGFADPDENWLRLVELAMFGLIASVAVVNTLVALTADRRSELRLLQLLGATDRELMRMLAVESALVVAVGLVLAVLAGGLSLVTFSAGVTGSPVPSVPMVRVVAIAAAAAALAFPSTLLTARSTLHSLTPTLGRDGRPATAGPAPAGVVAAGLESYGRSSGSASDNLATDGRSAGLASDGLASDGGLAGPRRSGS